MDKNNFYSKILLFGEYGIMLNSDALSIPFKKFHGSLEKSKLISNEQRISNIKSVSYTHLTLPTSDLV